MPPEMRLKIFIASQLCSPLSLSKLQVRVLGEAARRVQAGIVQAEEGGATVRGWLPTTPPMYLISPPLHTSSRFVTLPFGNPSLRCVVSVLMRYISCRDFGSELIVLQQG